MRDLIRPCSAELIGTFMLVLCGTGAIVINDVTDGTIGHAGIALTFGLIVMAVIYALGDVSGAHINPAVTVGFWLARRFPGARVLPYLLSQLAGALLASLFLRASFPTQALLGNTMPAGSNGQSFALETALTFMLMFVVICVSTGAKEKGITAGLAVGAVVGLEAMFAGPITGASMNPARSLAPAMVTGRFDSIGVYLTAPLLGAALAVVAGRWIHPTALDRGSVPAA